MPDVEVFVADRCVFVCLQKPFVSLACVDTEIAITSIFSRAKSALVGGETPLATGMSTMRFNLGA